MWELEWEEEAEEQEMIKIAESERGASDESGRDAEKDMNAEIMGIWVQLSSSTKKLFLVCFNIISTINRIRVIGKSEKE